jgi:hypothetical protein
MKKRAAAKPATHNGRYHFKAEVWVYRGNGTWHFVTLPKETSKQIKFFATVPRRGWGSVRVTVTIGGTSWATSIFPYSKVDCYILPLKAGVRKKENIKNGTVANVTLVTVP